jgi:hypothetical protein
LGGVPMPDYPLQEAEFIPHFGIGRELSGGHISA